MHKERSGKIQAKLLTVALSRGTLNTGRDAVQGDLCFICNVGFLLRRMFSCIIYMVISKTPAMLTHPHTNLAFNPTSASAKFCAERLLLRKLPSFLTSFHTDSRGGSQRPGGFPGTLLAPLPSHLLLWQTRLCPLASLELLPGGNWQGPHVPACLGPDPPQ